MAETPPARAGRQLAVCGLVTVGGAAALCWEGIWQLRASLALGVSARGTAITLAATMAGMAAGAVVAGAVLRRRRSPAPLRLYGVLEFAIGVSGLLMLPGFAWLERLDTFLYQLSPAFAPPVHGFGILLLLGVPTFAMGASVPLFELVARGQGMSIAWLYGLNTAGASAGLFLSAFCLIPGLGVENTCRLAAGANLAIFVLAQLLEGSRGAELEPGPLAAPSVSFERATLLVLATGFTTFGLEVAWFRALRASFLGTTETFAIMLASVLIPLAVAAQLTAWLRHRVGVGTLVSLGAAAILLATPVIERMDVMAGNVAVYAGSSYAWVLTSWFVLSLAVLGPGVFGIGTALPRFLDEVSDAPRAGLLYAANTLGAVCGSLATAWLLLPGLGFARSAWLLGLGPLPAALAAAPPRLRLALGGIVAVSLSAAVATTSSLGRDRIQSPFPLDDAHILAYDEGPDSTVSVVQRGRGDRMLIIDGFVASGDYGSTAYMEWMGRLPALLHPRPERTLVIAFGTGLTAHALREETLGEVDVAEISPAVLSMAPHFPTNHDVLGDPRVHAVTMDGRAWARRATTRYDVITLEPMPPHLTGMNALYSREFYEVLAGRLQPGGIVAQWVPFHLLPASQAASVAAAFVAVFADTALWVDPTSATGILLGRREASERSLGAEWPGLARRGVDRSLSAGEIRRALELDDPAVRRWARRGTAVTDDNQLLAHGLRRDLWGRGDEVRRENVRILRALAGHPLLYEVRNARGRRL